MAYREPSQDWRRQGYPPEQSFPPAPQYAMHSFDTNTGYDGYQPDSASYGNIPFPAQPARQYPEFRPTPRPPIPASPYTRAEPDTSFAARRQRRQYSSLPEDENQSAILPPRDSPRRPPVNDIESGFPRSTITYLSSALHPPSNFGASVPDTINEVDDSVVGDADKSKLVSTSVRRASPRTDPEINPFIQKADFTLNRVLNAIQIKKAFHWAHPHFFHEKAWFSWRPSRSSQPPRHYFTALSGYQSVKHHHLDVFHRSFEGLQDDQYLDPINGRVRRLFVQTIKQIYDTDNDTSWRRTYVTNVSPWLLQLAWWSRAGLLTSKKDHIAKQDTAWKNVQSRTASLNADQWTQLGIRWIPSCVGLLILMCFPTDVEGQIRNHGFYDPVPYRFWSYPKTARNYYENKDSQPRVRLNHAEDLRLSKRSIYPRYLCFPLSQTPDNPRGRLNPQMWVEERAENGEPNAQASYIFVSYTGEKQFERLCPIGWEELKQSKSGVSTCPCDQCECSRADANALHKIGQLAAQHARVPAYWTDQNCMSTDAEEFSEDIYGICDVVRGSRRIVVVVGRSGHDDLPSGVTTKSLLKEWGTRMWTWPEVLLAPVGKKITVYTRDSAPESQPVEMSKLSFARQVWNDALIARHLVEHFESSLGLSRLELVVLALECLTDRVINGTKPFAAGDLSYALMGLLRQRPKTEKLDTAFQAFSRLSLANDSDRLLERMICLLPVERDEKSQSSTSQKPEPPKSDEDAKKAAERAEIAAKQRKLHYWTNMDDHWGAKLWDIEPHCQVAGIAGWDTVILDGAYGATVHWDSFQRVAITTKETWSRMLGRLSVRFTPGWFLTGVITVGSAGGDPTTLGVGAIFLIISLILVLLSPILILHIYSGKVWNSQPWLFGFEGYMSLEKIEQKIFGFPCDRLSWAPYCSAMSRHALSKQYIQDECQGQDPFETGYQPPHSGSSSSTSLRRDGTRLFTLVDTLTMTVSTFYAERPPVIALLCGSEGGMQRAVMCTYDWTTQTLYRETVLRMETRMLERMPRIGRVRFGLKRGEGKA